MALRPAHGLAALVGSLVGGGALLFGATLAPGAVPTHADVTTSSTPDTRAGEPARPASEQGTGRPSSKSTARPSTPRPRPADVRKATTPTTPGASSATTKETTMPPRTETDEHGKTVEVDQLPAKPPGRPTPTPAPESTTEPIRPKCSSANGTWEQVQDAFGAWVCPPDPNKSKGPKDDRERPDRGGPRES